MVVVDKISLFPVSYIFFFFLFFLFPTNILDGLLAWNGIHMIQVKLDV